ncbi:MAG: hypothetical protein ABEJ68_09850 [Halobacteriaceae archaeon]
MTSRAAVAVCVVLLLAAIAGTAGVGAAQTGPDGSATIERTVTLSLTPGEPGRIGVTISYRFPSSLRSFEVTIPEDSAVRSVDGFEQSAFRRYEWTTESRNVSISFDVVANDSSTGGHQVTGGEYNFMDHGPWAIVRIPQTASRWSWAGDAGSSVSIETAYATNGSGYVGDTMAYLGPYERYRRTAAGQTFTLVVPDAADLAESPETILDALAAASGSLRVGDRDSRVNMFVAPTDAPWGARGIQYGDTDAWVLANSQLGTASNPWLHEYVHTRQAFSTSTQMRWFTEASAEYYAAFLALQQDRISYDDFRAHLARGQRPVYDGTTLAEPVTWVAGSQYYRGALVLGAIDRRVRLETGSRHSLADVFEDLNSRPVPITGIMFEGVITQMAGDAAGERAAYWVTTSNAPDTWSQRAHARAFGTVPPTIDARIGAGDGPAYRVTGPYGTRTTTDVPTLYPGETLSVSVVAENTGDVRGEETVTLARNSTPVDSAVVDLGSGEETTLTLGTAFESTGTYALTVGLERVTVSVVDPAPLAVSDASVNATTVQRGGAVTVSATVSAPADSAARGTVPVTVGGTQVDSHEIALGAGNQTTVTTTVTLERAGERTIRVGDQSLTVTVESATGEGNGGVPGFGVGAGLVAIAGAALVAARRR